MAYYTGQVNSFAELKSVIEQAASQAGWTLESGYLRKAQAYIRISDNANYLDVVQSTTADASGESPGVARIALVNASFPLTYRIHAFAQPDEIYCIIQYNLVFFECVAFGISDIPGIGGTGLWATGSRERNSALVAQHNTVVQIRGIESGGTPWNTPGVRGLFWIDDGANAGGGVHCGLDGPAQFIIPSHSSASFIHALWAALPSPLNEAHVLLPIKLVLLRPNGSRTIAVQHRHARFMRIDNVEPADVIEFGSERWKCYPVFAKNVAQRDGQYYAAHSGTLGYAIRYDGP